MFPKGNVWRCKKYTDAARGQTCVRCGADDETIVACHYEGLRQHHYGKGRSRKPDDLFVADLCSACHIAMTPSERKSIEHSEEFQHLILLTARRRIADGVLKT